MVRVLVIDDDPLFCRLVMRRLEFEGHAVTWQRSSLGALAAAREGTHDVLIIDVNMPEIKGSKLVECLRARGGSGRIILASGMGREDLTTLATLCGADAVFPKGAGLDQLASLVRSASARIESGMNSADAR